ncbi:MAG: DegT/DnrJ/EryC1/StrS family aminotransferase, partial [Burkholderiales bacterium]
RVCQHYALRRRVTTRLISFRTGRDEAHNTRAKVLALHGMSKDAWHRFGDQGYKHYQVVEAGFKYNMMDLQAAIGIPQLARVERNWNRREHVWKRYMEAFADLPIGLPAPPAPDTKHAYHLFTIMVDETRCGIARDDFLNAMNARRIGTGVHYLSVPEHPFYQQRFGWKPEQWPNATRLGRQTVSLPLSPKLSDGDMKRVTEAVRALVS